MAARLVAKPEDDDSGAALKIHRLMSSLGSKCVTFDV
jgi:hypothetical protein